SRIDELLKQSSISMHPDINVYAYFYIKDLLSECGQTFFNHPHIQFHSKKYVGSYIEDLKINMKNFGMLLSQTVASRLLGNRKSRKHHKREYAYGINVFSDRQLRNNQRGPAFLIDNKLISEEEVVYFPLVRIKGDLLKKLEGTGGAIFALPRKGRFFSDYPSWKGLLSHALRNFFHRTNGEIALAARVLFNYLKWQRVMDAVRIRHFITHGDFGPDHVGRNTALQQAGVQTWFFSDSMNFFINWLTPGAGFKGREPICAYLMYDHFVTWNQALAQYHHNDHPSSFKKVHVVGCLWSDHIQRKEDARNCSDNFFPKKYAHCFIISSFDSTYVKNGWVNYSEAINFTGDLLRLADDLSDIYIVFKEKKNRNMHYALDPVLGPKLIELYNRMDAHPRITTCSREADTEKIISIADLVVSFPFTSTTYEALSANRHAIWHDAEGHLRDSVYGRLGNVMTHGYAELKAFVEKMKTNDNHNQLPEDSPFLDPYRDGKAIDRFRELLANS
ncbi:MAG: polysaccharide biosynthesis PFTS motif protein, partial [Phycisphaerae bacterium]|nr:polysaccharide biosynthesis PFTS motif protein [Phycisphaerae bacterium]